MSLKQVSLDPFLLAQLYKSPVIPSEKEKQTKKRASPKPLQVKYLGNNTRHITLLVDNKEQPWLPDDQFTFLTKILQACGLSMNEVALVNKAAFPEITVDELLKHLETQVFILFGASCIEWSGSAMVINKPGDLAGCSCLPSKSLKELQDNPQDKKEFWHALQAFFHLKK